MPILDMKRSITQYNFLKYIGMNLFMLTGVQSNKISLTLLQTSDFQKY